MKKIFNLVFTVFCLFLFCNTAHAYLSEDLEDYVKNAHIQTDRNWNPPKYDKDYEIVLLYTINKKGEPRFAEVVTSSGDYSSDLAAMAAVQKAGPFKRPENCNFPSTIQIEFVFNYKSAPKMPEAKAGGYIPTDNVPVAIAGRAAKFEAANSFSFEGFDPGKARKEQGQTAKSTRMQNYTKIVSEKIQSNWHPVQVKDTSKITVQFQINPNGRVISYKLLAPSKDKNANKAAIKAIFDSAPFPSPELAGIIGRPMTINFDFDYNVVKKKT